MWWARICCISSPMRPASALARCDLRPPTVLKLRHIGIDAPHENVALIARNCRQYRPAKLPSPGKDRGHGKWPSPPCDFQCCGRPEHLERRRAPDFGERAFRHFGLAEGTLVEVAQANPPTSLEAVRRKMDGMPSRQVRSTISSATSRETGTRRPKSLPSSSLRRAR